MSQTYRAIPIRLTGADGGSYNCVVVHTRSVVLVEDEAEIRQGLKDFVPWEQLGFRIAADFSNGREALAFLLSTPVDLVLSDIRMPGLDGLGLARELKAAGFPGTLVLHTGHKDFEYARQAIEYGVRLYLIKSSRMSVLTESLRKIREEMDSDRPLSVDTGKSQHAWLVAAVQAYVEHRIGGNVTLKAIADKVGLHEDHLGRVFHEETGTYFSDFVLERRMAEARTRLSAGAASVADVANLVGYTSSQNFARAFQKRWGQSPSQLLRRPAVHED